MNKKQFSKIISLYNEGISAQICVNLILNYPAKNSQETAEAIDEFYMGTVRAPRILKLSPYERAVEAMIELGWKQESAIECINGGEDIYTGEALK
jgi:hypothetical protein